MRLVAIARAGRALAPCKARIAIAGPRGLGGGFHILVTESIRIQLSIAAPGRSRRSRLDHGRIQHRAASEDQACRIQLSVEFSEEPLKQSGLYQKVAVAAQRRMIRHLRIQRQPTNRLNDSRSRSASSSSLSDRP